MVKEESKLGAKILEQASQVYLKCDIPVILTMGNSSNCVEKV